MKTLGKISILFFAVLIYACSGNEKTEEVGVGTNAVVESIEALSDMDSLACTCEHKCKTKEECKKQCNSGCDSIK